MKRPDIEGDRKYIKDCCGRHSFTRFCESWGCSNVRPLLDYIEFLESKLASQPVIEADAEKAATKRSLGGYACSECGTYLG